MEAKKRELHRELLLIQAVRFGMHATQASYEERMQQLKFELRKYEEEYRLQKSIGAIYLSLIWG